MKNLRARLGGGIVALMFVGGITACAAVTPPPPTRVPTVVASPIPTSAPAAPTAGTSSGPADAVVKVARIQGFGLFLTDNADRTLYAYANDTADASQCTGTCLQNWPPFIVHAIPAASSNINVSLLTTLKRPDGTLQLEYDGHPLYYFAKDKGAGDVKGQSVGNVWHVLSPRGNPMMNPFSPPPTATP